MKVYIVLSREAGLVCEPEIIEKIFDNEEKAKAYVEEKEKNPKGFDYWYDEYEVE